MKQILLIGLGGFLGSIARYLVSKLNIYIDFYDIPVGTLTVNVVGSFILGFFAGITSKSSILTADLQLLVMVGICGGFTTFSSFTNENLTLLHNGQILQMFAYTGLSIILGFGAVYLGYISVNMYGQ